MISNRFQEATTYLSRAHMGGRLNLALLGSPSPRNQQALGQTKSFLESAQRGMEFGKSFDFKQYDRADIESYSLFRSTFGTDNEPSHYIHCLEKAGTDITSSGIMKKFALKMLRKSGTRAGSTLRRGMSPL